MMIIIIIKVVFRHKMTTIHLKEDLISANGLAMWNHHTKCNLLWPALGINYIDLPCFKH